MENFEQKALDYFGALSINKSFARKAGFGSRAIPVYVREWIVSHFVGGDPDISQEVRGKIANFVQLYAPDKSEREAVKNALYEQREVKLLDDYSVAVDLSKGDRYLRIPFLDENKAGLPPHIVTENEMLLTSGIWGVGTLTYSPPVDQGDGQIILRSFSPFQLASLDIDYFIDCRKEFSTDEWINFMVSSMGFNPRIYSERQKILLLSRLLPIVEPRYNLIELAPKGTGKSFVYENMSRYVAVRSGSITSAVLFYNDARKTPGLITRYDTVVIDEAQKVRGDSSGELTALLKSYLEAGSFGRGSSGTISAEAGLVILANIELDDSRRPVHTDIGLFHHFPNFLQETAFIDRFSGLLPGWHLPRITKHTPSQTIGLKGDIFGEIMHIMRNDISYRDFVKTNMELENCDDMRDRRSVEAGATGLMKIIFPDKNPAEEEFYRYCVNPALEMRQRVRDELCKMDREYIPTTFLSQYPDEFQKIHRENGTSELAVSWEENLPEEIPLSDSSEENFFLQELDNVNENKPQNKAIHINEDDTGYSYQSLFEEYLKGAAKVTLIDPYIRLEYQVKNLLSFAALLANNDSEPVEFHLITTSEDAYDEADLQKKYDELAENLVDHNIHFTYEFNQEIHDRSIVTDHGWEIFLGRGLDIYQKPDSKYELSYIDQSKRKCRKTDIAFVYTR